MQTTSYTFLPTSGQCATSTSHTIVVNPLPIVNVSPLNSTICSGNQTNIELISQPVGATFGWLATSVGDASGFTTGTGSSIEQILTSTSTGTVNYEVVGVLNGCPSLPVNVTVDVIHTPVVNASSYIHNLCSDQSVVVNLSSSQPATTFTWTTAATNVTGSFNGSGPVINQQLSTSFGGSVIYSVTPTFGICTGNPIDILVNVDGEPIPLIAITTSEGCSPIDVFFNNTTVGNYSYSWNFGDGTSSSEVSPSHSYTQNGCYDALLMIVSPAGCVSQTLFENVACVSESPTAFFTATNQLLYEENAFNSFINGSQNATSYLWDFGDGSNPVTSINPSYNFPPVYGNTYNVTLTAINDEGCTDTYLMSFTVQDNLVYYVPNTFTPDGDQYNQTFKPIFTAGFDPYDFNLKIFNRWGELIFESYNHEVGWNGTYKAAEGTCSDGVYAWTIEFKTTSTDARKKIQGHVVLMK
jgi:gliding motility-associated-like protein